MPTNAKKEYQRARLECWNEAARNMGPKNNWGRFYRQRLMRIYRQIVPPGQRVLEVGCGPGDLLAALEPALGIGVDFSPEMLALARDRHPGLTFVEADAHELELEGSFDFIVLSDLINDLWDVQTVLARLRPLCTPRTRIIFNFYSRLWEPPLGLVRRLGLAQRTLTQNWLTREDVAGLLNLTDFEVIRNWAEVLWPLSTPIIDPLCNRVLAKLWPFRVLDLTNIMIARPKPEPLPAGREPVVSVIIPARNEEGNIEAAFERTPEMGAGTELVFVEGHSTDNTYQAIERAIAAHPERRAKLFRQPGKGKGDAVRLGFAEASGDVLMILDADLTMPPEDLPRFYEALVSGKSEFINGVRLVYPMEKEAMRFLNLLGNKLFSLTFSWLLGQPVKDTLCGTKVLWKSDYQRIAEGRAYFGDFDPFGDFDLLFGAAKLNQKIIDIPIRYRQRTYGSTNISRFSHGWLLIKMVAFAARRIKFV